ncbi:diuretic hormone receptor isoform X2 [Tetranychus urticae]|uniref:Diuretic hormone receptor n=1 Tax=Tetranychus urticae TaxID=32264 RepID=T1JPN8_TETUR|nr:diuretic hormone receptor isoform X2 [Tetranychus urticae]
MIIFNLTEENGLNSLNDFYGIDDSFNSNDYFVSNLTEAIACENSSKPIDTNSNYCQATWDRISCWPTTPINQLAIIPCFKELNGIPYDSSQNASKLCLSNGTWAEKSDYSLCEPITPEELIPTSYSDIWNAKDASTIYYFGYGLSLLALTTALFIFLYFKDLRCVRNTIHTHLIVTYELFALTWIITATLQSYQPTNEIAARILCFLYILLPYFTGTQFFWMFIEGLYLYILVVKTFSSVESIKIHFYATIGWGLPALVVLFWAPSKYFSAKSADNLNDSGSNCPWQAEDSIDSIFICPILFVLMLNIFFLCKIMWVLITKLRAATSAESRQYRKAAKALLVLTPLLGVTYILFLVTPGSGPAKTVFTYLQATLYSTQGFTVSVFYCFLNGEVRNSVRHHLARWKTIRSLPKSHDSINGRKSIGFCSSINSERGSFFKLPDRKDSSPSNSLLASSGIMTVLSQPVKSEKLDHIIINPKSSLASSSPPSSPPPTQPQAPSIIEKQEKSLSIEDDHCNNSVTSKLINSNGHNDYNCHSHQQNTNLKNYYNHHHHYYRNLHNPSHLNHINNHNSHNNSHSILSHYCFHTQSSDSSNEDAI